MHVATVAIDYVCIPLLQIPQDYALISYVHMCLNNGIFMVHFTPKNFQLLSIWYIVHACMGLLFLWTNSGLSQWFHLGPKHKKLIWNFTK